MIGNGEMTGRRRDRKSFYSFLSYTSGLKLANSVPSDSEFRIFLSTRKRVRGDG